MGRTLAILAGALLLVTGCSAVSGPGSVPDLDEAAGVELQARAFMRACSDVICAGAPIYAPGTTSDAVREAILQFTDEVQYLSEDDLERRTDSNGRFLDGATLISVGVVWDTSRDDVRGVDVGISKGARDHTGRTYLFLWDGGAWVDTSGDAVEVTVTSSVS